MQAKTAQKSLDEQIREYDTGQKALQTSAGQAASGITNLVNEYNQAYATAKGEYEQRYNQMLGVVDSTTGQQAADINTQYGQQSAKNTQNLARLGMGNTTVGNTLALGTQSQQSQALNRLADTMQATKLGIISGHETDKELAPDNSALLAGISSGTSAAGSYGGTITQALSGLNF